MTNSQQPFLTSQDTPAKYFEGEAVQLNWQFSCTCESLSEDLANQNEAIIPQKDISNK